MDWIERWLGVSPDGGDGSLEALLIIVVVVCIAAVVALPSARRSILAALKMLRA